MEIKLYKTSSPRKKLVKELSDGITLVGTLRAQSSVMSPTFTVQDTAVVGYNYCYIPDFGRWYYINGIDILRSNLYELTLGIDVLMTYAAEIRNNTAIIDRTESGTTANVYIDNGTFVNTSKLETATYNFSGGFNDTPEYILITAGGIA